MNYAKSGLGLDLQLTTALLVIGVGYSCLLGTMLARPVGLVPPAAHSAPKLLPAPLPEPPPAPWPAERGPRCAQSVRPVEARARGQCSCPKTYKAAPEVEPAQRPIGHRNFEV